VVDGRSCDAAAGSRAQGMSPLRGRIPGLGLRRAAARQQAGRSRDKPTFVPWGVSSMAPPSGRVGAAAWAGCYPGAWVGGHRAPGP
jgi:hypothetical protein